MANHLIENIYLSGVS